MDETSTGAEIGLQVTAVTSGTLTLLVDGIPTASWPGPFAPEQTVDLGWERPLGLTGPLTLQLRNEQDQILISVTP
ncbi:MAG: hypothetical protein IPJ90_10145 [Anaerolineaceae bacterium]|nr:hypothetical protein [Anaerolineaceae bacterium]